MGFTIARDGPKLRKIRARRVGRVERVVIWIGNDSFIVIAMGRMATAQRTAEGISPSTSDGMSCSYLPEQARSSTICACAASAELSVLAISHNE